LNLVHNIFNSMDAKKKIVTPATAAEAATHSDAVNSRDATISRNASKKGLLATLPATEGVQIV
jgi:hypothetical protein